MPMTCTSIFNMFTSFLEQCKKTRYSVGMNTFDFLSMINIKEPDFKVDNSEQKNHRYIDFYYSTTEVKLSKTSKLITSSTFISSIGGNLGLFVGFSFISALLYIYELLEKSISENIYRTTT